MGTLSLAALAIRESDYPKIQDKVGATDPTYNLTFGNKFTVLSWKWRELYIIKEVNELVSFIECNGIPFMYVEYDEYGNFDRKENIEECKELDDFFSVDTRIFIDGTNIVVA